MVDADVRLGEAGDDDGGEVVVVFNEQDVRRAVAGVEHAGELGEEKGFVEGFLDPALGRGGGSCAGNAGSDGREDGEDDDRDGGGGGRALEALQGFPAGEAGHVEIEEDGFDRVDGGERDALLAVLGLEDAIAVAAEMLGDNGADGGVVVAEEDDAFSGGGQGAW